MTHCSVCPLACDDPEDATARVRRLCGVPLWARASPLAGSSLAGPSFLAGPHCRTGGLPPRAHLCTDVCVNFAYCADPMAQDDNCVTRRPNAVRCASPTFGHRFELTTLLVGLRL